MFLVAWNVAHNCIFEQLLDALEYISFERKIIKQSFEFQWFFPLREAASLPGRIKSQYLHYKNNITTVTSLTGKATIEPIQKCNTKKENSVCKRQNTPTLSDSGGCFGTIWQKIFKKKVENNIQNIKRS